MPKVLGIVFAVFGLVLVAGYLTRPSEQELILAAGRMDKNVYSNDYLNLSVDLPKDWIIYSREEIEILEEIGLKFLAGKDPSIKETIRELEKKIPSVPLFLTSKYEAGTAVWNPNIICCVDQVSRLPDIHRASDYLKYERTLIASSPIPIQFPGEIYTEEISGIPFDVMLMQIEMGPLIASHKVFATKIGNHVFLLGISYITGKQEKRLTRIVKTIRRTNSD